MLGRLTLGQVVHLPPGSADDIDHSWVYLSLGFGKLCGLWLAYNCSRWHHACHTGGGCWDHAPSHALVHACHVTGQGDHALLHALGHACLIGSGQGDHALLHALGHTCLIGSGQGDHALLHALGHPCLIGSGQGDHAQWTVARTAGTLQAHLTQLRQCGEHASCQRWTPNPPLLLGT